MRTSTHALRLHGRTATSKPRIAGAAGLGSWVGSSGHPVRGDMFERYTVKARRVIFLARFEASQFGSPHIEAEHLLLGLLQEDKALTSCFLRSDGPSHGSVESIRKQIEAHWTIRQKGPPSVDLPLSHACMRRLASA